MTAPRAFTTATAVLTERIVDLRDRTVGSGDRQTLADAANTIALLAHHLTLMTGYAEAALEQFANGRGYLDITAFHSLCKEARADFATSDEA